MLLMDARMPDVDDSAVCEFCKRGRVVVVDKDIAFQQWTDKGSVHCRVRIPVRTCEECREMSWDESAEGVIERAVRVAYEKLP